MCSLRGFAQGRCISQSPQEYPAGAIDVPVDPDTIRTGHHLAASQVQDDLSAPAAGFAGISLVDQHHVFARLPCLSRPKNCWNL